MNYNIKIIIKYKKHKLSLEYGADEDLGRP